MPVASLAGAAHARQNQTDMARAYIGLGSNLNKPRAQLESAWVELAGLGHCTLVARSRLYRSRAIGPGNQPDYINAVALIETELTPLDLLDALQILENAHQRIRIEHWGPRTLDLDLLLYDNQTMAHERLKVPHPYLTKRNFVLYPLADIAPELVLPCGTTLTELLAAIPPDGLELLAE
jgi:2-amino-4-hydroxy-6-hydroxymethyldihydropteridine diphosphokinase